MASQIYIPARKTRKRITLKEAKALLKTLAVTGKDAEISKRGDGKYAVDVYAMTDGTRWTYESCLHQDELARFVDRPVWEAPIETYR